MDQINTILTSEISRSNVTLDHKQKNAVLRAMLTYSERVVENYRKNESKAINLEAVKLFPSLLKGDYKLWLRKRSFNKAKKQAQKRANTENRKIYCIRSSDIAYTLLSTQEVKHGKKVHVFDRKIGALELTSASDFIAMPKRKL